MVAKTDDEYREMVMTADRLGRALSNAEALRQNPCPFCKEPRKQPCRYVFKLGAIGMVMDRVHEIRQLEPLQVAMLMTAEQ